MNGLIQKVCIHVVVDMLVAESACRSSSAGVAPIVMMICYVQLPEVFVAQRRVVAN